MTATGDQQSASEIRREVESTQSDIDATLKRIEHRLTPGQLVDATVRYFSQPGRGGRSGRGVSAVVARNPLPVVLIGVGLVWLAVASQSRTSEPRRGAARGVTPRWPTPDVEKETVMAVSRENLAEWLRDARAMEGLSIQALEKQVDRLEHYPAIEAKLREHLEESRRQVERVDWCLEHLGASALPPEGQAGRVPGEHQLAGLLGSGEVMRNEITNYAFEHFEIATYRALIEAAAEAGEHQIEQACEDILQEEEDMADWLAEHLPEVTRQYLYREAARRETHRPAAGDRAVRDTSAQA